MGTKYTEVTVSGYNTSPPSDDGSSTAANQVSWAKHKDKLTDPIKTALDTMDDRIAADTDTSVVNTSSSGSIGASYHRKTVTVSGASTLTLDNAATLGDGFYVTVVNVDASNLPVINTTSSEAIDGGTSFTFSKQYEAVKLFCNGSQFYTVATERDVQMTGGGVLAPHKNLVIGNTVGQENTQVDVDADEVLLTDGTNYYKATSVNLTIDITTAAAENGRDYATAESSDTWHHIWVIYDGTNVRGLLSKSNSAPTLPGSHTYYAYVGAIYNNSSGNLSRSLQRNKRVAMATAACLADGAQTAYTSLDVGSATVVGPLSELVPDTAAVLHFQAGVADTLAGVPASLTVSPSASSNDYGSVFVNRINDGASTNKQWATGSIVLITAQKAYYRVTGSADKASISITGWEY